MPDVDILFARAEAAFRAGQLDTARTQLQSLERLVCGHPALLHLLGMVEKRRGDLSSARIAFDGAMRLAPDNPEIANNAGNLLCDLGEIDAALAAYARAVAAAPNFHVARLNRAIALHQAKRFDESREEFERLLELAPSARAWSAKGALERQAGDLAAAAKAYGAALAINPAIPTALRGCAQSAIERGDENASSHFAAAIFKLGEEPELVIGEAEALEAEGREGAVDRLAALVERQPRWATGQTVLARIRWEAGESDSFTEALESAIRTHPQDKALRKILADSLAGADLYERAAQAAADAQAELGEDPEIQLLEAMYASEAGDARRADRLFANLPERFPGRHIPQIRHLIRQRAIEQALELADIARSDHDGDVLAWAYTDLLWRKMGDRRASWLHGQPGLVAVQELELTEIELAGAAEALRRLHRTRARPIGQSLRGGTQTRGKLFEHWRIEVARLRDAVTRALTAYQKSLPPLDPTHPLLRHRDRTLRFGGSWSVRLTDGGFHVAHAHPHGVLSSACYLAVPKERTPREGWLELGRPPPELNLGLRPLTEVKPVPGTLVLFPSTLFHGTRPFRAGERLTAAFDVVSG